MIIKSYKVRLYPTQSQEQLMWKHNGARRYIWNYMIDLQNERYENDEGHLSAFDMMKVLTPLKNDGEHDWLYEVSNTTLQITCQDLAKAYEGFFDKTKGYPKFKSRKKSKLSFPVNIEYIYFSDGNHIQIQKLGRVKCKAGRNFPIGRNAMKFINPRISYDVDKWILSFGIECESQTPELTDKRMGIDLGIKELAVVALEDEKIVYHNINKSKKMRTLKWKERHLQRGISRKYEAGRKVSGKYQKTANIVKDELKLAKLRRKQANIRENYIHQTTHELVSKLPCRVTMEDLNVKGMMKNRHLAKAIQEQEFGEFLRQMEYKCGWNGIEFQQADRFYPSSKTCSCCGHIKKDLKLNDRTYICPVCGFTEDRDFNAALNLMRYTA